MDGFNGRLRITMFPWLAFGHLIPFLELAKSLAQKGHIISFISTPRNIERMPKLPPNLAPLINLVSFPLPHVDELPANAEATMDLPQDKVEYLKVAFDGLEGPLTSFLENDTPDWIIYDFAPHWLVPVAARLGVPCVFFSIINAMALAFAGPPTGSSDAPTTTEQLTMVPKWFTFPSTVAYRLHEARKILEGAGVNASGVSDLYRLRSIIQGCHIVTPRSCMEVEPDCLRLLEDLYQKSVVPLGLLPHSVHDLGDVEDYDNYTKWLDKQKQGSVIYVAFGSEAQLNNEEVHELAFGLEQSNLPFFWVFRQAGALPEGFEDRNMAGGVVCKGWAPQLQILAHPSVGGFLTHSGWGSFIEGLQFGHAFVLLPRALDQGLNARMAEEMKIGVEIPRNEMDGSFTRESVADSIRLVMVEAKGEPIRSKASEMRNLFADKDLHQRYVDAFVEYLKDHRKQIVK